MVPNENSIAMPEATPTANVVVNTFTQNHAACSSCASPDRYARVCAIAVINPMPIESGTNTKWNATISVNCNRARNATSDSNSIAHLLLRNCYVYRYLHNTITIPPGKGAWCATCRQSLTGVNSPTN